MATSKTKQKPLTREDLKARYERAIDLLKRVHYCPSNEQGAWWREIDEFLLAIDAVVIHQCPPKGSDVTPCCGRAPFELSTFDRMTTVTSSVTCSGGSG